MDPTSAPSQGEADNAKLKSDDVDNGADEKPNDNDQPIDDGPDKNNDAPELDNGTHDAPPAEDADSGARAAGNDDAPAEEAPPLPPAPKFVATCCGCGASPRQDDIWCRQCGDALVWPCSKVDCGLYLELGDHFCGGCSTPFIGTFWARGSESKAENWWKPCKKCGSYLEFDDQFCGTCCKKVIRVSKRFCQKYGAKKKNKNKRSSREFSDKGGKSKRKRRSRHRSESSSRSRSSSSSRGRRRKSKRKASDKGGRDTSGSGDDTGENKHVKKSRKRSRSRSLDDQQNGDEPTPPEVDSFGSKKHSKAKRDHSPPQETAGDNAEKENVVDEVKYRDMVREAMENRADGPLSENEKSKLHKLQLECGINDILHTQVLDAFGWV